SMPPVVENADSGHRHEAADRHAESPVEGPGHETEDDLVGTGVDADRAEDVVGAVDGDWPAVHLGLPAGVVLIREDEKSGLRGADIHDHASGRVRGERSGDGETW